MRLILFLLIVFITGCKGLHNYNDDLYDQGEFERVSLAAKECTSLLSKEALKIEDTFIFSFAFYIDSRSFPLGESDYTRSTSIAIPYFIASTLDGGIPGEAWRSCMQNNEALVKQIKYK